MAREGGSYVRDENGDPVLRERTGAVVTTAQPPADIGDSENTSEVTDHEDT